MLEKSPAYLRNLANMPPDLMRAYRYGDWNILGGNYFKEFTSGVHTCDPFKIPEHWVRYRSFDYGLDRLAVGWWAVDEDGRHWLYRAYEEKDLIASKAAQAILTHTLPNEHIAATYAPWDLWSRGKDSGRMIAETFLNAGVDMISADRNRVHGHMLMKEAMTPIELKDNYVRSVYSARAGEAPNMLPGFMIFNTCEKVISDIKDIQSDDNNVNDCAKEPHEITHNPDMCRYYIISRVLKAEKPVENDEEDDDTDRREDYESFMTGGEPTASYLAS